MGWRLLQLRRFAKRGICRELYRDRYPDPARSVMLAGCGRSGTTWLAELIAARLSGRIMFEPFDVSRVGRLTGLHYFQYLRPNADCPVLADFSHDVFTGRIRHRWIDKSVNRLLPQYRIVKEIRANLFLKWLNLRFPQVPLLFMLRHPCAVVHSRMELNWATDSDIAPFTAQTDLLTDHLDDFARRLANARTVEEKHAIVWCVSNLVPLRQFAVDELPVVFYEDLCADPETTFAAVFRAIGFADMTSGAADAGTPSATSRRASAAVAGGDALRSWQSNLSRKQIHNILATVESFGLGGLYGDSVTPLTPRDLSVRLPHVTDLGSFAIDGA